MPPETSSSRAPNFSYTDAPQPPGEPQWDPSTLDLAVSEPAASSFDPVRAPYGGLRQRRRLPAPKTFSELVEPRMAPFGWFEMWRWNPEIAFVLALVAGITLLGASIPFGAATSAVNAKDLGFIWSLPWSIGALALYPVAMYLMVAVLRWLPDVLEEFSERGMLCDSNYQIGIRGTAVLDRWTRPNNTRLLVLVGGATIIAVLSLAFQPAGDGWPSHTAFRWLVVAWQIIALSTFFTFIVYVTHFAAVLTTPTLVAGGKCEHCMLVPDLSSPDERRGFELFEGVLQQLLMIGAVVFILCNLIRIDSAYRSPMTPETSVWAFVSGTIVMGFTNPDHLAAVSRLFEHLDLSASTLLVVMVAALAFLCGYYLLSGAVQMAAIRAARNARAYYRQFPDESLSGYGAQQEREQLDKMKMRPLLFPTPYLLLSLFSVGILSILFYGIGLYLFGIAIAVMLSTVIVRFIRRK